MKSILIKDTTKEEREENIHASPIVIALDATHLLFEKVIRRIAEAEGYTYPERAKDCAYAFLKS